MSIKSPVFYSGEVYEEFKEIFGLVDRDGGGSISKAELGHLLEIIGIEASNEELDAMIMEVDTDNSGEIEFDEFLALMTKRVDPGCSIDDVKRGFKVIQDTSGSQPGRVHMDAVVKFLSSYGSNVLSEERAKELVMQMDIDQDGYINYDEYVDMMMKW